MRARSSGSSPSGTGSAIAMLQRGSRTRLRPCSAIVDTTSTGSPASVAPKVTIDAHGVPSSDNDASEPDLAAATSVRASSPGVRRRAGSASWVGSAITGPSPGPPWFSLDSVVASRAASLMVSTVPPRVESHGGWSVKIPLCRSTLADQIASSTPEALCPALSRTARSLPAIPPGARGVRRRWPCCRRGGACALSSTGARSPTRRARSSCSSSTADKLLRDADLALYSAKASGKNRYVIFEPPVEPGSMPPLGEIPPHLGPTATTAGG